MHTTLFRLTPEAAAVFLTKNPVNRKIKPAKVAQYAADMLTGNWRLTHQGLLIGKDGALVDGQHRCHAVVKTGIAIDILLTFDDSVESPLDLPIDHGGREMRTSRSAYRSARRQLQGSLHID